MGVFRTKSVTENVEHYRETGVREGEAQNTTFLNVSFRVSSVPDFLDDGSRQFRIIRFVELKEAFQTFMNGPKMWSNIELPLPRANRTIFLVLENPTKVNQGYIRVKPLLHQHPRLMAHMLRHRN